LVALVRDIVAESMAPVLALLEQKLSGLGDARELSDARDARSPRDSHGSFGSAYGLDSEAASVKSGQSFTRGEFEDYVREFGFAEGQDGNPHQHAKLRTAGGDPQPRVLEAGAIPAYQILTENGMRKSGHKADSLKLYESIATFAWDANRALLDSIRALHDEGGEDSDLFRRLAWSYNSQRELYRVVNQKRCLLDMHAKAMHPNAPDGDKDRAIFVAQQLEIGDFASADADVDVIALEREYNRVALKSHLNFSVRGSVKKSGSAGVGLSRNGAASDAKKAKKQVAKKQVDKRNGGGAQREQRERGDRDERRYQETRGGGRDGDGSRERAGRR
jgi:hypothetical protein